MIADMQSAIRVIIFGIVLWSIALVVAIVVNAVAKIILTCLLAILLGFIGIYYTRARDKKAR
ncbi:MAG: hypothetical protein RLZZ448_662 [Actinomycetota bacterium]|jgi:hypothetical protein